MFCMNNGRFGVIVLIVIVVGISGVWMNGSVMIVWFGVNGMCLELGEEDVCECFFVVL